MPAHSPKAPSSPRAQEAELAKLARHIVEQINKRWINNVLSIPASEAGKFADANWARETKKRALAVKRSILSQLSDKRINAMVETIMRRVDKHNSSVLYEGLSNAMGINTANLMRDGTSVRVQALIDETAHWIRGLRDKTLQSHADMTLTAMARGDTLAQVVDAVVAEKAKSVKHATFLARNQIGNYNGLMTKIRSQKLGITRAIWNTAGDESVRRSHADRDGREYDQRDGCYSSVDGKHLTPGVDYRCRCIASLIVSDE